MTFHYTFFFFPQYISKLSPTATMLEYAVKEMLVIIFFLHKSEQEHSVQVA